MKQLYALFFLFCTWGYGQLTDFPDTDFQKADSLAMAHQGASLDNLPLLVHQLTHELTTEVEKFRAIYTWVCTNIENDYDSYVKTSRKRKRYQEDRVAFMEWNQGQTPKVFKTLREKRKTACSGYAFLLKEMAQLAEIQCTNVNGYGRTPTLTLTENSDPNHAWNAVKLNAKWYLCDATWSAGRIIMENDGPKFQPDYFEGYFLTDPALFIKNHYPNDLKWTLLDEPPSFKLFVEGPVVYREAFAQNFIPEGPINMHVNLQEKEAVHFKIKGSRGALSPDFSLRLHRGGGSKMTTPSATYTNGHWSLRHSFPKKGRYDVHLMVNKNLLATYIVRVDGK